MHKIELKRNDKCLCGSEKKYKVCCGKNKNIEFYQITDIDFILIRNFNDSIPLRNKSNVYHETYQACKDLEFICEDYKEKIFKDKKEYADKVYKYIFKKIISEVGKEEDQLYLCGIKELGVAEKFDKSKIDENIASSAIIISNLQKVVIPEDLYVKQEELKLQQELKRNNINITYQE